MQVEESLNHTVEYNTQELVQEAIWDEVHCKHFYLHQYAKEVFEETLVILRSLQQRKQFWTEPMTTQKTLTNP